MMSWKQSCKENVSILHKFNDQTWKLLFSKIFFKRMQYMPSWMYKPEIMMSTFSANFVIKQLLRSLMKRLLWLNNVILWKEKNNFAFHNIASAFSPIHLIIQKLVCLMNVCLTHRSNTMVVTISIPGILLESKHSDSIPDLALTSCIQLPWYKTHHTSHSYWGHGSIRRLSIPHSVHRYWLSLYTPVWSQILLNVNFSPIKFY